MIPKKNQCCLFSIIITSLVLFFSILSFPSSSSASTGLLPTQSLSTVNKVLNVLGANIIPISGANELNSDREIISDIYSELSQQDNTWISVPSGHYIRATFDRALTNQNDITVYAKGVGTIEVYTKDSTTKIMDINISGEKTYRTLLINLSTSETTFDLKIVGNIQFDYLTDPIYPSCVAETGTCSATCGGAFLATPSSDFTSGSDGLCGRAIMGTPDFVGCNATSDSNGGAILSTVTDSVCDYYLGAGTGDCARYGDTYNYQDYVCPSFERKGGAVTAADCVIPYQECGGAQYTISDLFDFTSPFFAGALYVSAATNVSSSSATLNGNLFVSGTDYPTVTFYYGTTDGGTITANWQHSVSLGTTTTSGAVSYNLTGLSASTTYYYTIKTTNTTNGDTWATSVSFTTIHAGCFASGGTFSFSNGYCINTFNYSGTDQLFITSNYTGNKTFMVKSWGAGGAGGQSCGSTGTGGGGGYSSAYLVLSSGSYSVVVGKGGISYSGESGSGSAVYGGGGLAAAVGYSGQGGGLSGIFSGSSTVTFDTAGQARSLAIAGGGGGGGCADNSGGGAGGGLTGENGYGSNAGKGGTQIAGGLSAYADGGSPVGSALQGASSGSTGDYGGAGGGGGGYYGGSSGWNGDSPGGNSGGGGGSGYVPLGGTTIMGSYGVPGNSTDSERGTAGTGGAYASSGNNGLVIIKYLADGVIVTPIITLNPATNVSTSSATISGTLDYSGENQTVTVYYGTTDGGTTTSSWTNSVSLGSLASGDFSTNITGLTTGTTYYFRAKATNSAGTTWASSTQSFIYYTDTQLISGLVGYWKMNNNWLDSSGNNNNGTAYGNATFTSSAKVGSAAGTFDGSGDYTKISDNSSLKGFSNVSFGFWYKRTNYSSELPFIAKTGSAGGGDYWIQNSGSTRYINVALKTSSGIVTKTTSNAMFDNSGNWSHFFFTFDGTDWKLYLNGNLVENITDSKTLSMSTLNDLAFAAYSGGDYTAALSLDNIMIYSRALSSSEISNLYNAGSGRELTISNVTAPSLTVTPATNVASTSATLNGTLVSDGNASTTVTVYWGTTDGSTTTANWTNSVALGTTTSSSTFSTNITGLTASTTYYFRAKATNSAGTTWASSTQSFIYYTDAQLTSGLIGYWKMNNNWLDSSGNGNNGTANGNATFTATTKLGSHAGTFDGTGDYISVPDSNNWYFSNNNFSIGMWVYLNSIPTNDFQDLMTQRADNNNRMVFYLDNRDSASNVGLRFSYAVAGNWATADQNIGNISSWSTGQWYYINAIGSGNTISLYRNNTFLGSSSVSVAYANYAGPLTIGGEPTEGKYTNGKIDDTMIYNRALSASEISALYNSGSGRELTISTVTSPSLTVTPATNIASTTATLNGVLSSDGGASTTVTMYWGTTDGGTTTANWTNSATLGTTTSSSTFSTNITGLTARTLYYFTAKAVNSAGATWATSTAFITKDFVATPYVWVANSGSSTVTKLSSSGTTLGTYPVGSNPRGIAVDASGNVWITNAGNNNIVKLSSIGTTLGTYTVGSSPTAIALDISGNAWVSNFYGNSVTKLSSTGTTLGTYSVGTNPRGIAVDASGNVWVANSGTTTVTKLSSSGTTLGTYSVGASSYGIAVDASGNVWITRLASTVDTPLSSTGTTLGTYTVGTWPSGIAIDASGNIWVANQNSNSVTKLSSSGTTLDTYSVGAYPYSIAVDASGNVWVANIYSNFVTKLNSYGITLGTYSVGGNPDSSGDFTGFAYQYFVLGYPLQATVPALDVITATSTTATSTIFSGVLNDHGGATTTVTIYYGATDGGTTTSSWASSIVATTTPVSTPFTTNLTGLNSGTTYYYRTVATNSAGTTWATSTQSFTTSVILTAPTLTLNFATNVAISTATLSGNLTSAGGTSTVVTLYWGTSDGGTTTANWTNNMTALTSSIANTFTKNISSLLASTKYYFTAAATNSIGTTWTSTQNFTTTQSGTSVFKVMGGMKVKGGLKIQAAPQSSSWTCGSALVDTRDSQSYSTVQIGSQCWMRQNMNIGTLTTYVLGNPGANNQGSSCSSSDGSDIKKYCYGNLTSNCSTYGGFYQWNQLMCGATTAGSQGICPTGWHIPTHDEFTTLERAVCTSGTCATDFPYDITTVDWRGTNEGTNLMTTNTSHFSALLSGYLPPGTVSGYNTETYFWTSTQNDNGSLSWGHRLSSSYGSVYRSTLGKTLGASVRCLKD